MPTPSQAPNTARLDPQQRDAALARMREETFDVVVIGGGATGTGCALDAASRGLSVALVEARDFASGTSSRSSKLVHGGLRYLEQMEFGLVHEALRERGLLLNVIAPHLVRPVPFLLPLTERVWQRAYVGAGMLLYDELGGHKGLRRHRHLSKRKALRIAPALKPDALIGAIQYWDSWDTAVDSLPPVLSENGKTLVCVRRTRSSSETANASTGSLYRLELQTGVRTLVAQQGPGFAFASGNSLNPSISSDGRFIAFQTDLLDLNGRFDVYLHDALLQTNYPVSVNYNGTIMANGPSANSLVSPDGAWVLFQSGANDITNNGSCCLPSFPTPAYEYARNMADGKSYLLPPTSAPYTYPQGGGNHTLSKQWPVRILRCLPFGSSFWRCRQHFRI